MFKHITLTAAASLALLAPSFAQEAAAPVAPAEQEQELAPGLKQLLKNVPDILDKKWKGAMVVTGEEAESGNTFKVDLNVHYQDLKHFKADVKINAVEKAMDMEMNLDLSILCDGEFVYVDGTGLEEMGMPFPMPVKVKMDVLQQAMLMGVQAQEGEDANLKDLVREGMKEMFGELNVKEEGSTEDTKRYVMENEDGKGHVVFNAKSWIPQEMKVEAEGNVITMKTTSSGLVEEFPEGTFKFTVPEGKTVTDLTAMLQMQLPQEGGDEDLEF